MHSTLTRNYAAELQDDAQKVINRFLKSDPKEMTNGQRSFYKYKNYPALLQKAMDLLGAKHYIYPALAARLHFYKGLLYTSSLVDPELPDTPTANKALLEYKAALSFQADLPFVYWMMAPMMKDSMEFYFNKAYNLAPGWITPLLGFAANYPKLTKDTNLVNKYLSLAKNLDSNSLMFQYQLAVYYRKCNRISESVDIYLKIINNLDSSICIPCVNYNLAVGYAEMKQYEKAEKQFRLALSLDSTDGLFHYTMGLILAINRKLVEAEKEINIAIELNEWHGRFQLGDCYYELACIDCIQGKYEIAFSNLEKAIKLGMNEDYKWINEDSDLEPLRKFEKRWKALMKKYYPDKLKE